METWIIGVLPLSTGCQKEKEDSDADGTLGTMPTLLGEMTTKTQQSEEEASATTRICRKPSRKPPSQKLHFEAQIQFRKTSLFLGASHL